jgi:hypothetical protein
MPPMQRITDRGEANRAVLALALWAAGAHARAGGNSPPAIRCIRDEDFASHFVSHGRKVRIGVPASLDPAAVLMRMAHGLGDSVAQWRADCLAEGHASSSSTASTAPIDGRHLAAQSATLSASVIADALFAASYDLTWPGGNIRLSLGGFHALNWRRRTGGRWRR